MGLVAEDIIERYQERLKKVIDNVRIELERFSWHCSKISKVGDGAFAIAASRDPHHLSRDGEPDEYDFEVRVETIIAHPEDSDEVINAKFKMDIIPFEGPPIFYKFIDSLFPPESAFKLMSPVDLDQAIESSMRELETIEPYDIVKMVQKWLKGKLPQMQK